MALLKEILTGLAVALSFVSLIIAAPVPMEANRELSDKIRHDATDIMEKMGFKEGELKLIRKLLNISPVSLEHCESDNFNQENCYSQLLQGLNTAKSLLESAQDYKEFDLTIVLLDLEELISNIKTEMEAQGFAVPTHNPQGLPRVITPYQKKAGVFLILHDLINVLITFQEASSHQ